MARTLSHVWELNNLNYRQNSKQLIPLLVSTASLSFAFSSKRSTIASPCCLQISHFLRDSTVRHIYVTGTIYDERATKVDGGDHITYGSMVRTHGSCAWQRKKKNLPQEITSSRLNTVLTRRVKEYLYTVQLKKSSQYFKLLFAGMLKLF